MKSLAYISLLCTLVASVTCFAEPIGHIHVTRDPATSSNSQQLTRTTVMNMDTYNKLTTEQKNQIAQLFNLKSKEYKTFLSYMNNTMDGYEYDQAINPNLVLAMHTQDPKLYRQYLANVARADHDSLARLLKVSVDYPIIMRSLYPHEMPIMTPAMQADMKNKLQSGDVIQLFCRPKSAVCSNLLGVLKATMKNNPQARLDLFFVGQVKREDIVAFAKNNMIPSAAVSAHQITLNFGNDAFSSLEKESKHHLPLPYLLVRRDGTSIPVNLGVNHA